MEEIHPIPGHPLYGVSRDGLVWSKAIPRTHRPDAVRCGEWREITQTLSTRGYPKVKLTAGATLTVHRIVALVFHGEPQARETVDHKDGNKLNPSADNLEYVSQSENNRRAWQDGRQSSGWQTRRARLAAMGSDRYERDGRYPGMRGKWARPISKGG